MIFNVSVLGWEGLFIFRENAYTQWGKHACVSVRGIVRAPRLDRNERRRRRIIGIRNGIEVPYRIRGIPEDKSRIKFFF